MEGRMALPRTRKLPPRNSKMTSETLNFRKVARQVMLANMFTRRSVRSHYTRSVMSCKSTAAVPNQMHARNRERKQNNMTEKPPIQRRGTPDLFPMSEEMKQTIISLGRLDLLPDEERKERGDSVDEDFRAEKSRVGCKFRDKTKQKIIHPQRFIRNVRSSLNNSKRKPENSDHCEEKPNVNTMEDDNISKNTEENQGNCTKSTEESDAGLNRKKSTCNILARPQTMHWHLAAKSGKNQHYSLNNRPVYVTRYSDLGPFSTRRPTKLMTLGGIWQTNSFDKTRLRTKEHYFPKKIRSSTFNGKAWVANDEISSEEGEKINDETLKTRRWKSVESLTREIEEKCLNWLENRYGIT